MDKVFTLEAVFAKHGDALLLHYGPSEEPSLILIDGGPRGVYRDFLHPRLEELRDEYGLDDDEALPFEMVMVSHIDDDHIAGIIDLFEELEEADETGQPRPYQTDTLWHNSFDDILGNAGEAIVSSVAASAASVGAASPDLPNSISPESVAVVQSTKQGRTLRKAAKKLSVALNKPFEGLVMAPASGTVQLGHGLDFTVIGPSKERIKKYQKKWDKDLKDILADEKKRTAKAAAFDDRNPFNLASICVLAELDDKKVLLTGDARGDFVLEGLEDVGLLNADEPFHIDVLKVPHHGSDRNVEPEFFEKVTADHYVVSGDGKHGNPERCTLNMIQNARGDDGYTIHFTFTEQAHETEESAERKEALERVAKWVEKKPDNCAVVFRQDAPEARSIHVDLLDPL